MIETFNEDDYGPLGRVGRPVTGRRSPESGADALSETAEPGRTLFIADKAGNIVDDHLVDVARRSGGAALHLPAQTPGNTRDLAAAPSLGFGERTVLPSGDAAGGFPLPEYLVADLGLNASTPLRD